MNIFFNPIYYNLAELAYLGFDWFPLHAVGVQPLDIQFMFVVPYIANYTVLQHLFKHLSVYDIFASRCCNDYPGFLQTFISCCDLKTWEKIEFPPILITH